MRITLNSRLLALWLTIVTGATALFAHPDKIEKDLLLHFATGTHPIENGAWSDLTHSLDAKVHGGPVFTNVGPARALVFDGYTSWLEAAGSLAAAEKVLPKKDFTVAAWVFLEDTRQDGGIAGFVQDNGGYERGWFVENDCRLYVGRGVGVTVLPLRIDAPPEVPIVTLRCRKPASSGYAAPLADADPRPHLAPLP
jgi:hypothetical protein